MAAQQGIDLYKGYCKPIWLSESLEALMSHSMSAHLQNGIMLGWDSRRSGYFDSIFEDVLRESSVQLYIWASPERIRMIDLCERRCRCPAISYPNLDESGKDYFNYAREAKQRLS